MNSPYTLCLSMITRNCAPELDRALSSVQGGYDELIIVDTGSKDNTREVANKWGAKVLTFTSANDSHGILADFSAARNKALEECRANYWWWMDSDEVAASNTVEQLRFFSAQKPNCAVQGVTQAGGTKWYRTRMAPNDDRHRWRGSVHEWVENPFGSINAPALVFYHRPRPERGLKPILRNLNILKTIFLSNEASGRDYFYLSKSFEDLGKKNEAISCWELALSRGLLSGEHKTFAFYYLARLYFCLNRYQRAVYCAKQALFNDPRFAEAFCLLGDIALKLGSRNTAIECYEHALLSGPSPVTGLFREIAAYSDYPRNQIKKLRKL